MARDFSQRPQLSEKAKTLIGIIIEHAEEHSFTLTDFEEIKEYLGDACWHYREKANQLISNEAGKIGFEDLHIQFPYGL